MSSQENKSLVRQLYEQVFNTGDISRLDRLVSPEYVEVHEGKRYPLGLEGAREHVLGVRRVYPDLRLTVEQQIAEGEWVATRITMRGTQKEEWMGMQPTGQPIEVTAVNLDRIVDGRIVEHGGAASLLEPLLRVGAIKVVGPAR